MSYAEVGQVIGATLAWSIGPVVAAATSRRFVAARTGILAGTALGTLVVAGPALFYAYVVRA